ncbi:MAG: hypothetical protein HOP17_15025 [Acidobacteria bacterium]|nr:hypothetical protein [Acidobacteriota bacterium]
MIPSQNSRQNNRIQPNNPIRKPSEPLPQIFDSARHSGFSTIKPRKRGRSGSKQAVPLNEKANS